MYEDPKSKISQLEKVLDAKEDLVTKKIKRHELHDRDNSINQDWDQAEFQVGEEVRKSPTKENSFSNKVLLGSIIFFVLAILVVAFKFIGGGNMVSGNNILVSVKAPISVSGGDVMPFEVSITNNNNVTLSSADLGITFPLGAKDAVDTSIAAKRVQDYIGDISPGQTIKKNYKVALFGVENEKKDITIALEYKISGSNSLFNKIKTFSTLISSSPVSVVVSGPAEVNTNQTLDYNIEITSNSPSVIKNLLLKADYPFGFSFVSSNPKTFSKNNLWLLGDLAPGEKRVIQFSGILSGQEGEERGFNFSLGSQSKTDNSVIDVPFTSSFSSVVIRRPFVSADIILNGSTASEYVGTAGGKVEAAINWRNNLPYEVSDVSILVRLNGNTLDKSSVQVDDGYYKSIDNTILFNKTTNAELASLEAGKIGSSKFSFSSFSANSVTGSALINPTITMDIIVSGRRVDYQDGQDNILFADSRKVKITANPQLFAKALYYVGPFQNSGPIPPKAEQETTYTITWTVTNPLNNLTNAMVSATLPPYIKWLGMVSPDKEKMSYDASTGAVIWSVGNVPAGAGTVALAREVSFQISFLPSVNQIGMTPDLISDSILNAKDSFTLTPVSDSFGVLNTRLTNDPYFKIDNEAVKE
jgi:hypothetical protein